MSDVLSDGLSDGLFDGLSIGMSDSLSYGVCDGLANDLFVHFKGLCDALFDSRYDGRSDGSIKLFINSPGQHKGKKRFKLQRLYKENNRANLLTWPLFHIPLGVRNIIDMTKIPKIL